MGEAPAGGARGGLEDVLQTDLSTPARVDVAVAPGLLGSVVELVAPVTQHGDRRDAAVVHVGLHTPAAVQQVRQVDDVGVELQRVTAAAYVDEEVLSEVQVHLVDEGRDEGITRCDATYVLSDVGILLEEGSVVHRGARAGGHRRGEVG